MWNQRKVHAYLLLSIVASNCLLMTYAFPQQEVYQRQHQVTQSPVYRDESVARKFAVKPNASKKVALDDIEDDLETNQIQVMWPPIEDRDGEKTPPLRLAIPF